MQQHTHTSESTLTCCTYISQHRNLHQHTHSLRCWILVNHPQYQKMVKKGQLNMLLISWKYLTLMKMVSCLSLSLSLTHTHSHTHTHTDEATLAKRPPHSGPSDGAGGRPRYVATGIRFSGCKTMFLNWHFASTIH